jgi:signal peptidase I
VSTEPPPPVNPYAPSEALAHGDAPAGAPEQAVQRRPHRWLAIIVALLAQPLAGAGLYVLGRRSAAVWMLGGLCAFAAVLASVIAKAPAMFIVTAALLTIITLTALVYTTFARPGTAPPRGQRGVLLVLLLIVAARGGNFAAKKWVAEAYQIPSAAMLPTLLVGDHIMVAKTKRITAGDVIVFRFPLDRDVSYVKRAIAVGGQTVEVKQGVVLVDGVALRQLAVLGDCPSSGSGDEPADVTTCRLLQENAGAGWYSIMRDSSRAADFPARVVPPGHLFVLGDNRDNSSDSRVWGPLPLDLVEGRAAFVWWSRGQNGPTRWDRVGRKID